MFCLYHRKMIMLNKNISLQLTIKLISIRNDMSIEIEMFLNELGGGLRVN